MTRSSLDRFADRVALAESGCLLWTGPVSGRYGHAIFEGQKAHRWYFVRSVGSIPTELRLKHLCGQDLCVLPEHLVLEEPAKTSMQAALSMSFRLGQGSDLDMCEAELHEMVPANIHVSPDGETRICARCRNDQVRGLMP